ncbi:MAG: cell envelope integrity protein TolA, partial [Gammaproteobacteria bacterium]|nr:cell envelope integrity protein TolA [Gammaproteobacteria bacterium]
MGDVIRRNPLAFFLAVLMHAAIVAFMVVGVDWLEMPRPPQSDVEIVEAVVVDESRVAAQMSQIKAERKQREDRQRAEEQRLETLKRQQDEEQKRLAQLEEQRQATEQEEAR